MTLQVVGRYFKHVLGYEDPPPAALINPTNATSSVGDVLTLEIRIAHLYEAAKPELELSLNSKKSLSRSEKTQLSKDIEDVMRHRSFLDVVTEEQLEVMSAFIVQDFTDNIQHLASRVEAIKRKMHTPN